MTTAVEPGHHHHRPVTVNDQHRRTGAITRFNATLAVKITSTVGTMWCAYAFAAFDLLSLPAAIRAGTQTLVSWVAQTFLQLVLLSVIIVGQNVQAAAADARALATFQDAEAILQGQAEIKLLLLQKSSP